MMGQRSGGHRQLFYSFNLEDHIPPDHLLRGIDRFLDLSDLRQHLAPFYSHTGRPSIDPQLLIRMLMWVTASASAPSGSYLRKCT
jgi:transposase